jgi:hypothetical protein
MEGDDFMEISSVTRKVIKDLGKLTDQQFMNRYKVSKSRYTKRLIKYGDPYIKSPLAKIGKFLKRLSS